MRKILICICLAWSQLAMSQDLQDYSIVLMNKKVVVPAGEHGGAPKSPSKPLAAYQCGHTFCFDPGLAGCPVSLSADGETVFSTVVGETGQVEVPASLTGAYELQVTTGNLNYVAEVTLAAE